MCVRVNLAQKTDSIKTMISDVETSGWERRRDRTERDEKKAYHHGMCAVQTS